MSASNIISNVTNRDIHWSILIMASCDDTGSSSCSSSSLSSSSSPSPSPSSLHSLMMTSCHVIAPLPTLYHSFSFLISASLSIDSSTTNTSSNTFTNATHVSRSQRIDQTSRSYVSILHRRASRDVHSASTALAAWTRLRTSDLPGSGMYV